MKTTIKLAVVLTIALVFTVVISPQIFPSNSPAIRPQLVAYLGQKVQGLWGDGVSYIASIFHKDGASMIATYQQELKKKQDQLANVPFNQLSKGVYAKDEGKTHAIVEVRLNEIEFVQHTFTVNGKQIIIRVPKDQQPPSQQVLDKIYGN